MNGVGAGRRLQLLLLVPLAAAGAWLGYVILTLDPAPDGPAALDLGSSGVGNPVTAVLINFRAYDTLLETAVLLVAMLGVWSLGREADFTPVAPGPILDILVRAMVPLLVLVAAYLLWRGAQAPGGAFQAGSVLGSAGVIMLLSGWRFDYLGDSFTLRLLPCLGLWTFIIVGAAPTAADGNFLQYPPAQAGWLILLIETAATISIGFILAGLFVGGSPESRP